MSYSGTDEKLDFAKLSLPCATSLDSQIFKGNTSIKEINLVGSKIEAIETQSFDSSVLNKITIPSTIKRMGTNVFNNSKLLTEVYFYDNNNLTEITNGMFANCSSLSSVKLPKQITLINNNAFEKCSALSYIEIPENVTKINNAALRIGSEKQQATIKILNKHKIVTAGNANIINNTWLEKILVPQNLMNDYKQAPNWSQWATKIQGYEV